MRTEEMGRVKIKERKKKEYRWRMKTENRDRRLWQGLATKIKKKMVQGEVELILNNLNLWF